MSYFNKKDVLIEFKNHVIPHIPKDDVVAKREAWNDYVDFLEKENHVNVNRSRNWSNPF